MIITSSSCTEGIDSFAVQTSTLKWTSTHPWNASISDAEQHPLAACVLREAVTSPHLRTDICHDSRNLAQKPLMFVTAGEWHGTWHSSSASLHACGKKGPCDATIAMDDHPCRTGKGGVLVLEDGGTDTIAVGVVTNAKCNEFGMIEEVAYEPIQRSLSALRRFVLTNAPPSEGPSPSPAILLSTGDISSEGGHSTSRFGGIARMGDTLYVADSSDSVIRGVPLADGGEDAAATLLKMKKGRGKLRPQGIAVLGNFLYVTGNNVVAMFDVETESASVVAGSLGQAGYKNGKLLDARFDHPVGIAISGGLIYVADTNNDVVRVINMELRTLRGQQGQTVATLEVPKDVSSGFSNPQGILAYERNELLMTDNHAILKVVVDSPVAASVEVLAGDVQEPGNDNGPGASARFNSLTAFMALNGTELFVSDKGNAAVRSLDLKSRDREVRTAYRGSPKSSNIFEDKGEQVLPQDPMGLALSEDNSLLYITDVGRVVSLPRASLYTEMCGTGLEQHYGGSWAPNTTHWFGR